MEKKRGFVVTTVAVGTTVVFVLKAALQSVIGYVAWQIADRTWKRWRKKSD